LLGLLGRQLGEAPLVDQLRTWRSQKATAAGMEPYMILNDRDLMGIAIKQPQNLPALSRCHGMGPKRMARYGDELVRLIAERSDANHDGAPIDAVDQTAPRDRAVWLFKSGVPWERVVREVGRSDSTVRGYFVDWIMEAPEAEWTHYLSFWFTDDEYDIMVGTVKQLNTDRLRPLYDALQGRFRFEQWDIARAVYRRRQAVTLR